MHYSIHESCMGDTSILSKYMFYNLQVTNFKMLQIYNGICLRQKFQIQCFSFQFLFSKQQGSSRLCLNMSQPKAYINRQKNENKTSTRDPTYAKENISRFFTKFFLLLFPPMPGPSSWVLSISGFSISVES